MRSFVLACLAIVLIAVAAGFTLHSLDLTTQNQSTGDSVRIK